MHLREGERIVKIFHHHPTPFLYDLIKVIIGAFPFVFLLFLFKAALSSKAFSIALSIIVGLFILVVIYVSLIYWLDKLVVTNLRVVLIDWKYLTIRRETEALLNDIQDIKTKENGFLASLKFFDYGEFTLATASAKVTFTFIDAPDPEGMRRFIYQMKHQ